MSEDKSKEIEDKNTIQNSKYYKSCINVIKGVKCNGKWFHYKAKEDNGYCKNCIKIEKLKT